MIFFHRVQMAREYEFEKYCANIDSVDQVLDRYGVAIIPSLLDETETKAMRDGMWDYLEHITQKLAIPIERDRPESWKTFKTLYPSHSMLLQHWGVGHSQMLWDLRQNQKVYNIFSKIYNTIPEELIVSFDGASFHFPPEITGYGWYRNGLNLHCDQSFLRNDKECIQSWVTANPIEEGDATLTFLESSHKFHKDFAKQFNMQDKSDWYKLEQSQIDYYTSKGCPQKYIACPEGSMVLWDSRTIHCGIQPMRNRNQAKIRCVGYVCYTSRKLATQKDLKKRIQTFNDLRMTSHWPHKPRLFSKFPRTYGGAIPDVVPVSPPVLSEIGKRMVGF
jgi:hypothetical protein